MRPRTPLLALLAALLAPPAAAGTLGDFEQAATRPSPPSASKAKGGAGSSDSAGGHDHCDDDETRARDPFCDLAESIGAAVVQVLTLPFVLGGQGSLAFEQGHDSEDTPVPRRVHGDLALPRAALEVDRFQARDDIRGLDLRAEAGYAFIGADIRYQRLDEAQPADRLEITRAHLLFRGLYGPLQVNLGLGRIHLGGSSGDSRLAALQLPLGHGLALRASAIGGRIHGNDIEQFEGALLLKRDFGGLQAGYQRQRAGGVVIEGPLVGLSLRY